MKCPVCKTKNSVPLVLEEGLRVSTCENCEGIWISYKNYSTWLVGHEPTEAHSAYADIECEWEDVKKAKLCSECGKIMLKYKVGQGLNFYIDHCSGCGGIWLDGKEWEGLKSRNLHDEIHKIFSTSWQEKVRREHTHMRMMNVYKERFGEGDFEKAVEVREWIQQHSQKQAIIAFLSDEDPYAL